MKTLDDYLSQTGPSTMTRIYWHDPDDLKQDRRGPDDLKRLKALREKLTVAAGGKSFSLAQVLNYLLDVEEAVEDIVEQSKSRGK